MTFFDQHVKFIHATYTSSLFFSIIVQQVILKIWSVDSWESPRPFQSLTEYSKFTDMLSVTRGKKGKN